MGFRPVTIPLSKGRDSGSADFDVSSAAQDLIEATNVVFTETGAIRGRPGTVTRDGIVTGYDGQSTGSSLSTPLGFYQPAGLHAYNDQILLQCHGRLFSRDAVGWRDVGACWSVRRTTFDAARVSDGWQHANISSPRAFAVDMGPGLCGMYDLSSQLTTGFQAYEDTGDLKGRWAAPAAIPEAVGISQFSMISVAGAAVFYVDPASIGTVRGCITGTFPAVTNVTVDTGATVTAPTASTCQRMWAAWDGTNYYVAFTTGVAPTQSVKIVKLTSAGAVVTSMTYAFATTIYSVCIAVGTGNAILAVTTSGGANGIKTRIFKPSNMTDQALDVNYTATSGNTYQVGVVCGISGTNAYVAYNDGFDLVASPVTGAAASLDVRVRDIGGTTSTFLCTYSGSNGNVGFQTLFPPQLVAGRMLMGIQRWSGLGDNITTLNLGPWTWSVVDVTADPIGGLSHIVPAVVAAGVTNGAARAQRASSACVTTAGALLFGVSEGTEFTSDDIQTVVSRPVLLTPQAAPSAQVGHNLILGGNVTYAYDGKGCAELNFVGGTPVLSGAASAGGSMTATASFTFAAVWVFMDATGSIQRSAPSVVKTITTTGVNKQVVLNCTAPQTSCKTVPFGTQWPVSVEYYGSTANPAANAPLNFIGRVQIQLMGPGVSTPTLTVTTDPTASNPEMYTSGGVIQDDPAPSDRGVVVADNRVWVADERTLYASHIRTPNVAPAWNEEVFIVVVPEAFGRVQGLAAIDDKVAAVCEFGVVALDGPGFDDQGSGPGWSQPQRISMIGGSGPARSVCSHPGGGAYVGTDGLLYGISRALAVQPLGMAMRDLNEVSVDVVYVPPGRNIGWDTVSNPLLVYGSTTLKVMDLTNGQWAQWTGITAQALVGTAAGLHARVTASPYVVRFSASGGQDLGVNFTMSIRLRPQETTQEGLMSGWGRIRSVNPVFQTLGAHTVSVQVYADESQIKIMDKSFNVGA